MQTAAQAFMRRGVDIETVIARLGSLEHIRPQLIQCFSRLITLPHAALSGRNLLLRRKALQRFPSAIGRILEEISRQQLLRFEGGGYLPTRKDPQRRRTPQYGISSLNSHLGMRISDIP
jgi:hypothetical protein